MGAGIKEKIKDKSKENYYVEEEALWEKINAIVFVIINIMCLVLTFHKVFWYDEAYTVGMVQREFSDIIRITSNDVHTPFYYCILKLFYMTIGMKSLISIKIFSWIFFDAYLILGEWICRKHFGRKLGFFWLVLSGYMPSMVIQTTSARMKTFGMFWVTLAAYQAYSLYIEENNKKWILLTISTMIAVYIHTFCMIEMVVVYVLFIISVLIEKRYKVIRNIFISGIFVSLSFMPWLIVLWKQFSRWAGWESGWSNTIAPVGWDSLKAYLAEWFSSLEDPQNSAIYFGILLCVLAGIFTIKYIVKTKDYLPCMGVVVAVIVFAIAMMVSVTIVPCFLGRYLFPIFGGVWLFVAVGISRIPNTWIRWGCVVLVLIFGAVAFKEELMLEDEKGLEIYQNCMEQEWDENDIIMADSYFQLMMSIYYPKREYMVYGSMPNCLPFNNCEVFQAWEQLDDVDTVWYLYFKDFRVGSLEDTYTVAETWEIPFSYYDIVLEKCIKNR